MQPGNLREQKKEEVPYARSITSEGGSYSPATAALWNIAGGPYSGMSQRQSLSVKGDREHREEKERAQKTWRGFHNALLFSQNQLEGED